ncbi:MAG: hypothetical protein JWO14_1636 [Solirubrobacterales bacterium]|nr:hypothetical protein [Solirubrobacterales bacterium]
MSVEKRRAAGRRRRARIRVEQKEGRIGQAEISLYIAGLLLFLLLVAFSLEADHKIAAFAVAFQTGTALLFSPDVLRPLRRLRYFQRPLTEIRAKRRRVFRWGAVVSAVLLALLGLRVLKFGGTGSNTTLLGAIVVLLALICGITVLCLVGIWAIDMLFEGAAETWTQTVVGQFGSERTSEVRRAFAVAFFFVGTLLMFWGAYN